MSILLTLLCVFEILHEVKSIFCRTEAHSGHVEHRGPIETSDDHVYADISCDNQFILKSLTNVHPCPASFAWSLFFSSSVTVLFLQPS